LPGTSATAPVNAPLVPKEGACHQIPRQCRTVDGDEWRVGARTVGANPARQHVPARATFSAEQEYRVRGRRSCSGLQEPKKCGTARLEKGRFATFVELLLKLRQ